MLRGSMSIKSDCLVRKIPREKKFANMNVKLFSAGGRGKINSCATAVTIMRGTSRWSQVGDVYVKVLLGIIHTNVVDNERY